MKRYLVACLAALALLSCVPDEAPVDTGITGDSTTSDGDDDPGDGDGDGDPGDGDPGDGDPGDGDPGDGDPGDGDGDPGTCGDGVVGAGEECDDGPNNSPDAPCLDNCVENVCGDGFEGAWEGCDDGNVEAGDGCSPACELEGCGNGMLDPGEECDDGNPVNIDECSDLCHLPECGDGLISTGEECDDGPDNTNDGECTLTCTAATCGDGLIQVGVEECDNGDANANDAICTASCTNNVCGDGYAGPGEGCDDGNNVDNDACSNACLPASCGDGVTQQGEACDDGNAVADDGCTNACALPACGDDILQQGEECDEGNQNAANAACTPDCTNATCGDGFLWAMGGEACDDGNNLNTDGCTNACAAPVCGDGFAQPGEECDDGNQADNDGCAPECTSQHIVDIDAYSGHTCVLMPQDTVRCWGYNTNGALGQGHTNHVGYNNHPYQEGNVLVQPQNGATQIGVGDSRTCILMMGGGVRCFGSGTLGALGYASTAHIGDGGNDVPLATDIMLGEPAVQIAVGNYHNCALLQSGGVICWGTAGSGELGYANTNRIGDNEHPVSAGLVDIGGPPIAQIVAGWGYTCTRHVDGSVRCWGTGFNGEHGHGHTANIGDDEAPSSAGPVNIGGGPVTQLSAGEKHTCALLHNGQVRCWGRGESGRLGYGITATIGDDEVPAAYGSITLGGPAVQIDCGSNHSCAVLNNGTLRCWGDGTAGRLGYGNLNNIGDNETPASAGAVDIGGPVSQVATGGPFTCAILQVGGVKCWGEDDPVSPYIAYPPNHEDIGDDEDPSVVPFIQIY